MKQVQLLRQITKLMKEGYKISELAQLIQNHEPLPYPKLAGLPPEHLARVEYLYNCLISFDQEKAEYTLANLSMGLTHQQLIEFVFTPILIRIGNDWQVSQICIAQEHFASSFLRLRLAPLLASFNPTSSKKNKVICTTLQNDQHEGGLMLFSMHLKLRDWNIFYLGSQMPMSELKIAVERVQPNLVCISTFDHSGFVENINEIKKLNVTVCVGGGIAKNFSENIKIPKNVIVMDLPGNEAADYLGEIDLFRD